ncbi:LytTR family transcriptional regulator [Tenacibaculum adriaticum]|uniref:LytTR family transcriptional regulator n=1 Tax=Tenacibaculum adriaticum TaxID=413713 RepID=A0A5S5DSA1_9FLAO|nr:LytTR family DNA-binding domain-containing protein [Tenacibaculum adriaticum]TYP98810.1 LytTR family transcriptional regulator [Tenacibaculum adriaticum]
MVTKGILNNNYRYLKDWKSKIKVMFIVFSITSFIILFLEPFKTDDSSKFIVLGYSICTLISYLLVLFFEDYLFKKQQLWLVKNEITVFLSLFILSAISVYWYDVTIIKKQSFYWNHLLAFTLKITIPFGVLLIPLIAFLRYHFGKIYELLNQYIVTLKGSNKSDFLEIDQRDIFYIKSSNNYIEVKYLNSEREPQMKLIRCTLAEAYKQLPFFLKSHRSYLVNPNKIKSVEGTQKKATLQLKNLQEEIPVSKSYYNSIKSKIK